MRVVVLPVAPWLLEQKPQQIVNRARMMEANIAWIKARKIVDRRQRKMNLLRI